MSDNNKDAEYDTTQDRRAVLNGRDIRRAN